jgi:hypothetical protein
VLRTKRDETGMPPRRLLIALAGMVALAYAVWVVRSGIRIAVDTATYSQWADRLIAAGFDIPAYLTEQRFVAPPILYLLWIVLVAALKTLLGASWMTGVVALNWIALGAGVYATVATVRLVTHSGAGMLLAALLFLVAGDLLIFVPYVLSDVIFWGLSTAVLASGVAIAGREGDRDSIARPAITGAVLLAMALLFRPVAVPLALFWMAAIGSWLARPLVDRFARPLLILAAAATFGVIVAHAYVLVHPEAWPFGSLPGMLTMVAAEYRRGEFVHQPSTPMAVTPAADLFGFVRMTLQKVLFFVTPWLPHYSAAHTLINLVFFVPAYGLSMAAIANLPKLAPRQQRAASVLVLFILFLTAFHAMLLIDSDHRYRLPALPALIMLAAIGLESVRRPRTLASIARKR